MHGRTSEQSLPPLITKSDDIELFVENFKQSSKYGFPDSALAFAPLLYIDPDQLPEEAIEDWAQCCDDLVRVLTASSEHENRNRLFDLYLPVTVTEPELLHWIGQMRIARGIYYALPEEILHGYDHQAESLIAVGLIDEAKQTIKHINAMQSELGSTLINTDDLLAELDSSATDPAVLETSANYIENTFSAVERNPQLGLADLDIDFEAVAANLSAASLTEIGPWIGWFVTLATNDLANAETSAVAQLDKTLIEAIFVHNSSATAVDFDKELQPWYLLFHNKSLEVLNELSPRTAYYALSVFAKTVLDNPHGFTKIEERLDRLSTIAADLGDYKTALEAINKQTRYAQTNQDYRRALASAERAHTYGKKLLEAKQVTATPEVLWATRSWAQLLSWAGKKAESADLLLEIPKRFTFADLNFNAQVNYIFSRIELAQLFQEARQEEGQRLLLREAADLYEAIDLKAEALKLRQTHRL